MKILTVTFFGHRDFCNFFEIEEELNNILRSLLKENEYVEFLVGRNGEFDSFVSSTIRNLKKNNGHDNCALVLVLPYSTAEHLNNEDAFLNYYDEIEICSSSNNAHFKSAILKRNKSMIDRADIVICYLERKTGGAYQAMKYAEKMNKLTVNLAKKAKKFL